MADCRGEARFAAIETVLTGKPNGAGMLINRDPCANASPLRLRHAARREGGNPVARSVHPSIITLDARREASVRA